MLDLFVIFSPGGPTGTTTIEMQPFLSPAGSFTTQTAWGNFTTSFFLVPWWPIPGIAFISLVILIVLLIKRRGEEKHWLFFIIWTLIILIATLTQRRFAYYLVVNIALLSAYLCWEFIRQAAQRRRNPQNPETPAEQYKRSRLIGIVGGIIAFGVSFAITGIQYFFIPVFILGLLSIFYGFWAWVKLKRKNDYMILWAFLFPIGIPVLAFSTDESGKAKAKSKPGASTNPWLNAFSIGTLIILVFLAVFYPNYNKSKAVATAAIYAPTNGWEETMQWVKNNTPEPLGSADAYYELYDASFTYPESAYGITAWWDYGYQITRNAHRLPSSNPSQAPEAIKKVAALFLATDDAETERLMTELDSSYIILDNTMTITKLWAVATWAGQEPFAYIDTYYVVMNNQLQPIQVFTLDYYRLLSVRLYNFDGKASAGERPIVITYEEKADSKGTVYRQITGAEEFDSYTAALNYINSQDNAKMAIAGSSPFINPIPMEAVTDFELVFSSSSQTSTSDNTTTAEVKVFRYLGN